MNANNEYSRIENIMESAMSEVRAMNWVYIITNIVNAIKRSLVVDDAVHPAIKEYLLTLSKEQFDFYFMYRIGSDNSLYSCSAGRQILKEYDAVKTTAHSGLRSAGLGVAEVELYDSMAYLLDHRSQVIDTSWSLEGLLLHNYERGFLQQLCDLCEKYQHTAEMQLLKNLIELLGKYQEHQKIQKRATAVRLAKELELESGRKSWYSWLKQVFS